MSVCKTPGCYKEPFGGPYCRWCRYQLEKYGKIVQLPTEKAIRSYIDSLGFVDRGDPSAWDWTHATLTTDGNWHDLDCSAIVPTGTKVIYFRMYLQDDVAGSYLFLRKKGNSGTYNAAGLRVPAANADIEGNSWVSCNSSRMVQYMASNVAFTVVGLLVRAWHK